MSDSLPDIGGAGLVLGVYEYLWTKNHLLQTRCMYHKCPPVLIPDTFIMKNKVPVSWYCSSLKSGTLQRRNKDLSIAKASLALSKSQSQSTDIMCLFVGSAQGCLYLFPLFFNCHLLSNFQEIYTLSRNTFRNRLWNTSSLLHLVEGRSLEFFNHL